MNRLNNKVAIITGAANGMGLCAVKLFLKEGCKVVASDIAFDTLKESLADYTDNENLILEKLDVTNEEDWNTVIKAGLDAFGKINVLINNAGVSVHCDLLEQTQEGFNKQLNMNLTSVFLDMNKIIPIVIKDGGGSIVNCGSVSAHKGSASQKSVAYCSAKSGLIALMRETAWLYGKDGIRVNTVHPGPTYTAIARKKGCPDVETMGKFYESTIPLPPHAGEEIDIANAYLFFASDESKFITGQEISVCGGYDCI